MRRKKELNAELLSSKCCLSLVVKCTILAPVVNSSYLAVPDESASKSQSDDMRAVGEQGGKE